VGSIQEDAITPGCHQALDVLRETDFISDFYLAGGTALALQIVPASWLSPPGH
jgi:hypothetical protein